MTSPMVDTVRNIPLRVERGRVPMDAEMRDETGFPFDDREARGGDDAFQSQLDDLAKRHPEFAEHFGSFPFREGGSSSRPRREHPEFRRFADRPFGQRFERFGFPGRDLFHENYPNGSTSQEQPTQSQQQPQPHQAEATHPEAAATSAAQPPKQEEAASKPPEVPQENRRRQQNIQQSNTVDLGQKQEPVNDRNQRSMSAPPPDSRGGQQRFVSSIQIPINSGGMGDMGGQQSTQEKPTQTPQQHSQPQQQQQHQPQQQQDKASKPMERVIPIHVEGRDEPVMPKHGGPTFAQQQHQPQPETIFGQRPGKFTQYVPRQFGQSPFEEPMRQQQQHYQPQQQQKFQQQQQKPAAPAPQRASPQPQPQPQPQAAPQPQQQPQRQQTPPQQPKPQTPIDIIQSIQKDVSELMSQVEKFAGQPRDKQYLYLDEMLTRNLLKLDNVDTQGQENIRSARKEAIRCIERCIGVLEAKAAANVPQSEQMEVETKAETQPEEIKPECSSEEAKPETPSQEQMEVVASAEKPADEPQAPKAEEESMEVADEPDKKKKSKQKKSANE